MNSRNKHYPVNAICPFFSCCPVFVYVLALIGVAHAKTIDEAKMAYTQGRFAEAARVGESLGTSQGFVLSAKSLSVHANYIAKKGEKKELLEQTDRPNTPNTCLLYTSPSPRDRTRSRMPSSA